MSGFVDEAQLHARAGDGGAGSVSFRREAHVPKGGPDGGDGGTGGDVWVVADHNTASLIDFKEHPFRRATNGTHGMGKARHGKRGKDITVRLPVGTVMKDLEGNLVVDLAHSGDRFLAARAGRGGRGNMRFLSNMRRVPSFAEQGEHGEERWYDLELKLMADVAIVGFPNAGKSTLISRVSAAKPKVADYPFTTLEPHLGVVRFDEHHFVMADIPGLIEGAAEGRGLGHKFLRHIERARVILVLIDLSPADGLPPAEQERILLQELGDYQPEMLERPRLIVGSKADAYDISDGADRGFDWDGPRVSAVTGEGIPKLLGQIGELVDKARATVDVREGFVVHRPEAEGVTVEREGGVFIVTGRDALRAVAVTDLTNAQALAYVQHRLKKLGVDRALVRAGAAEGDFVRIGKLEFEFEAG
ncbi:MAG TPA: GTPase ObgE [Acidimicrobiales bacterium]|nr:GTPase ObgE [Acidimicrobiales bacterium]